jgi:FtsZ-binding cell division protein ZapB
LIAVEQAVTINKIGFAMPEKDAPLSEIKETAHTLSKQAKELRQQARDLSQEAARIRAASKRAREHSRKRQK